MSSRKNKINLKAPGNWINDPNGFIYFAGKYHLFYQYFPYAPFWGTMHWGHAISDDLVNWEHLGIALMPTKDYDRNGIFSGSAVEIDGEMYIYYTAVVYESERPENIHLALGTNGIQSQAMLISDDGIRFDNFNSKKRIIPEITDTETGDPHDCRDPKVWKYGDSYYMCLASTHLKKRGVLLIFKSMDGIEWDYLNRLESEKFGHTLECPDLFQIDGSWILVCSPMGICSDEEAYPDQAIIQHVKFDENSGEVSFDREPRLFDCGLDLYAPQSSTDEEGRRVIIAWARMKSAMKPFSNPAAAGTDWNGMMSIPRVLEIRNGDIYTVPHPNIRRYFDSEACVRDDDGKSVTSCDRTHTRMKTSIAEGQQIDIQGYKIRLTEGKLIGDRSELVPENINIQRVSSTPFIGERCELEIYTDDDLIEIFVNDGRYVLSHVTYRNAAEG